MALKFRISFDGDYYGNSPMNIICQWCNREKLLPDIVAYDIARNSTDEECIEVVYELFLKIQEANTLLEKNDNRIQCL